MAQSGLEQGSAHNTVTEWVNAYSDDLYRYAVKRITDENLARDLVQTTFLSALQSFHSFQFKSKPKTWLTSILKNKIMDHFRQVYRRNETFIESTNDWFDENGHWKKEYYPQDWGIDEVNVLDDPNFVETLDGCIDELPERWQTSIRIKYFESDTSIDDLGVSKSNYWKMLERARTRLRLCLEAKWFNREI